MNQVIEVLDKEHGKRVIKYWKNRGINTVGAFGKEYDGDHTKKDNDTYRFYGVIDGKFDNYSFQKVNNYNAEIIELPENRTFPRIMLVGDSEDSINTKRVVFAFKNNKYIAWRDSSTFEEAEKTNEIILWRFAKEIDEPKTVELTVSQLLEKTSKIKKIFGLSDNDQLIIKM